MKTVTNKQTFIIKKDCIINDYFKDANDPMFCRLEYCSKNCDFNCLKNLEYKKIISKESKR